MIANLASALYAAERWGGVFLLDFADVCLVFLYRFILIRNFGVAVSFGIFCVFSSKFLVDLHAHVFFLVPPALHWRKVRGPFGMGRAASAPAPCWWCRFWGALGQKFERRLGELQ